MIWCRFQSPNQQFIWQFSLLGSFPIVPIQFRPKTNSREWEIHEWCPFSSRIRRRGRLNFRQIPQNGATTCRAKNIKKILDVNPIILCIAFAGLSVASPPPPFVLLTDAMRWMDLVFSIFYMVFHSEYLTLYNVHAPAAIYLLVSFISTASLVCQHKSIVSCRPITAVYAWSVYGDGGERTTHCCTRLKAYSFFFVLFYYLLPGACDEANLQQKKIRCDDGKTTTFVFVFVCASTRTEGIKVNVNYNFSRCEHTHTPTHTCRSRKPSHKMRMSLELCVGAVR